MHAALLTLLSACHVIFKYHRYPRMAPHQHVVLVPNAFGSKAFFDCDADCYDSMMAKDAARAKSIY